MRCPKCGHEQANTKECEACGVIFEKYRQFQERKKQEREKIQESKTSSSLVVKILLVTFLIATTAGTTYYFTAGKQVVKGITENSGNNNGSGQQEAIKTESLPELSAQPEQRVAVSNSTVKMPEGNPIDRARNATVSIETPWGNGSGFFINDNFIVTNRHVVEMDQEKLLDFRQKVETARELVRLERRKIRDWKKRKSQMAKGPTRSQLAILIENSERRLQKILPKLEKGEERLANLDANIRPSDIKIILADGSEYQANYVQMSENYDLALMAVYGGDWRPIKQDRQRSRLKEGEKVFTIGSPHGLRHTVTSGIFSSYRIHKNGQKYLQTDAPINPGNSGGPLIDEDGNVHGVTTMILRNTEGIGFAIPISVVYDEFSSSLY